MDPKDRVLLIKAYGQIIISGFGLMAFALAMLGAYLSKDTASMGFLTNTVGNITIAIVSFWIGSSLGSQNKDTMLASATVALANSSPVPGANAAPTTPFHG